MLKIAGCIVDGHDLWLVVVAGLVCMLASHASFSLLHRARRQEKQRTLWLSAAAIAMGCGVWATHFIAMLAYRTPMLVGYDVPLTVLSALIAVCLSGVGLWLVLRGWRSEEQTSELQSLMRISYAVFCLKKNTMQKFIL